MPLQCGKGLVRDPNLKLYFAHLPEDNKKKQKQKQHFFFCEVRYFGEARFSSSSEEGASQNNTQGAPLDCTRHTVPVAQAAAVA